MVPKQKKSPEDFPVVHELTKEEKEIIEQTKVLEKRENIPQKTGVVLTGGIDSSVTLCLTKGTKTMEIQPIVFTDDNREDNTEDIKKILEKEGLPSNIKYFEKTNTKAGKKEVLQWCFENNVSPLTFGSCYEEYLMNNLVEEKIEWTQLASEMNNYSVHISDPNARTMKADVIKMAKDFNILDLTAKPSDSSKYKKIREEAFKEAKIIDPHVEIETTGQ